MSAITEDHALLTVQTGLSFGPVCYSMETPDGEHTGSDAKWQVELRPKEHLITRQVSLNGKPWEQCGYHWAPETVIWPAWPGKSADEAATAALPLAGVEEYWRTVGNRLRDSAKWMATVLGAALVAVAGTSPLAGMREHAPPMIAVISGALGLILLGITLLLVIQVMRPQVSVLHRGAVRQAPALGPAKTAVQVAADYRIAAGPVPALRDKAPDRPEAVDDH